MAPWPQPTNPSIPTASGSVLKPSACDSVLPRSSTMGGLSLRAKNMYFWRPILTGQLDCHPGGLFCTVWRRRQSVIYAKLCTSSWKNPCNRDIDARTHSQRHFDYEPLSSCRTHRYLRLAKYFLCHRKPPRACTEPRESIFPCKAASVFLLVSDYQAWPGRSKEELLSCQRDRETAQRRFGLIWKLNLSVGATLRLSSSGPNASSQSVDGDFGIGIAIAPSGRVLFISLLGASDAPAADRKGCNENRDEDYREGRFYLVRASRARSGAKSASDGAGTCGRWPNLRRECRLCESHYGYAVRATREPERLGCCRKCLPEFALGGDGR